MSKSTSASATAASELEAGDGILTSFNNGYFVIELTGYLHSGGEQAALIGIHPVEEIDDIPGRYETIPQTESKHTAIQVDEFHSLLQDSTGHYSVRPLYGVERINNSSEPVIFDMKL